MYAEIIIMYLLDTPEQRRSENKEFGVLISLEPSTMNFVSGSQIILPVWGSKIMDNFFCLYHPKHVYATSYNIILQL